MNILVITTEWPDIETPFAAPFLVDHLRELEAQGVEVNLFSFKGRKNIKNYFSAWLNVRRLPCWKSAQILHAHWGQSAFISLFSRRKLVITYHGCDLQGIINPRGGYSKMSFFLVHFSRWIAKKADHCILVSSHLIPLLPSTIKNISIIPIGVDLNKFYPMDKVECRHKLNLDKTKTYILFASDPTRPEKRFSIAEQAIKAYNQQYPEEAVELVIACGIHHSQMPTYYSASDALILTSFFEGSPTVIKEALACNTPIVSFDVGDVRERIKEIPGCYLCNHQTVNDLVEGLRSVLTRKQKIDNKKILGELSERTNAAKVVSIYKQIIGYGN